MTVLDPCDDSTVRTSTFSILLITSLAGCGMVLEQPQPTGCGACTTGTCIDGVCCDRACDATCEACTAAKTGGVDGTCAPIIAGTDPNGECADQGAPSCGASGAGCNGDATAPACVNYAPGTSCAPRQCDGSSAVAGGTCDGNGTCELATAVPCGYFGCNSTTVACRTTCATNTDCSSTGYCNVVQTCAKRLHVALETGAGSCTLTEALPVVKAALEARGHTVTLVSGTDIDTAGEIAAFDVVVTGALAACAADDRSTYDAVLGPWVQGGGGLVGTGWVLYVAPPANFGALMPNTGMAYLTGAQTMTPVGTHPIVNGLAAYAANSTYTPYGGSPKAGSTQLLKDAANNSTAQAWTQGSGRVVFLGPLFIDDIATYTNHGLTNGSTPSSLEMLMRSIEWAGGSL